MLSLLYNKKMAFFLLFFKIYTTYALQRKTNVL